MYGAVGAEANAIAPGQKNAKQHDANNCFKK